MIQLLHVLYLGCLPLAFELGTEVYRARVLHRNDRHFITGCIRLAIMAWGAFTYNDARWYLTLQVEATQHYLIFNYAFNKYGMINTHWSYLGNNLLDRLQKYINPHILLLAKICLFALAVGVFLYQVE